MAALSVLSDVLLAVVFAVSAWGKLHDAAARRAFTRSVRDWGVVPGRFAGRVAAVLAAAETGVALLLAAALVTGTRTLAVVSGAAATLLLLVLTAGLVLLLRRGVTAACSCFGASTAPMRPRHVARNTVLLGLAVAGTATTRHGLSAPAAVLAVGFAALGALVAVRLDEIVDLFTLHPEELSWPS